MRALWIPSRTRSWSLTWALTPVASIKFRRKRCVKLWAASFRITSRKYQWAPIQTCSSIKCNSKLENWETINQPSSTSNWSIQLLTQIFSLSRSLRTAPMTFQVQEAPFNRNKAHLLKINCNRKCHISKARKSIRAIMQTKTLPHNEANKATNQCRSWSIKC